jgi:uncharacterized protein YdaU (DUF1376 family)
LLRCFVYNIKKNIFTHKRLAKEILKQKEWSKQHSDAGKLGAAKRWKQKAKKDSTAMASPSFAIAANSSSSPSSSSSSSSTSVKERTSYGDAKVAASDTSPVQDKAQKEQDPVERRIWKDGIDLLTSDGMTEAKARPFLGRLAKQYSKPDLAMAIAATQSENPADRKAFLIGVLKERSGKNKPTDPGKIQHDYNPPEPCVHCGDPYCLKDHREAA